MIYFHLFLIFTYVSIIGFGGGTAMIPLFERLLVNKWISSEEFMNIIALSQATPGAFSINLATYVGYVATSHKYLGALVATLGHCVVGFFMCTGIGNFLKRHEKLPIVQVIFNALKPLTTALLIWSSFLIAKNDLSTQTIRSLICFFIIGISFFLLRWKPKNFTVGPIHIIFLGGFLAVIFDIIYSYLSK